MDSAKCKKPEEINPANMTNLIKVLAAFQKTRCAGCRLQCRGLLALVDVQDDQQCAMDANKTLIEMIYTSKPISMAHNDILFLRI